MNLIIKITFILCGISYNLALQGYIADYSIPEPIFDYKNNTPIHECTHPLSFENILICKLKRKALEPNNQEIFKNDWKCDLNKNNYSQRSYDYLFRKKD